MKKLNFFQKYKLKYTNREEYIRYKRSRFEVLFEKVAMPDMNVPIKDSYSFKHSGNSGDLIYALPTMLGIAGNSRCNVYLHLNQPSQNDKYMRHPLGDVMLNSKMLSMLKPLLLYQSYIGNVLEYADQAIDFDLDLFRKYPLKLDRGSIARWYMLIYPVYYDLTNAWIGAPKVTGLEDAIVIARSFRYNSPGISYQFMGKYPKVYFVGVEEEYREMQQQISHLQYLPVDDFLQLAGYISSAKLFIGNQSFPFSLAEAMKVNRLLEVYYDAPNVNVYGPNGFDFCYQPQFEYLVKMRFEKL